MDVGFMGDKKIDVKAALKQFRNHWIHENDVLPLLEMEKNAREEIEKIVNHGVHDDFKNLLVRYLDGLPLMRSSVYNPIMENNTIEDLKAVFVILFNDKKSESDRLAAIWNLEGIGKKYASYFMDIATKGEYMMYDVTLLKAIRKLEPKLLKDDFFDVNTIEDLLEFMKACGKVYKKHKFSSYAELRGFLWNGYGCNWNFDLLE